MEISINRAAEIGAGDRYSSQLLNSPEVLRTAARVDLYEPNDIFHQSLADAVVGHSNVNLYGFGVSDISYEGTLYTFGYASYLAGSPSFLSLSVEPNSDVTHWAALRQPVSIVDIKTVEAEGEIDLLVLTCGGVEVEILERMISRPKEIYTKHYCHNAKHWAEANKIFEWMRLNGYTGTLLKTNTYQTFMSFKWTC